MTNTMRGLGVLGVVAALLASGASFMMAGQKKGLDLTIGDVDLTKVPDGVHKGSYKGGRWSNSVEVTVAGHKIQRVSVVDDVLFKDPKTTQSLFERVVEKQTPKVDVISGGTITSKAYLKSIENALSETK